MTQAEPAQRWKVVLAFALVYVFWGSTYLFIRIAIEHIPPPLMAGTRFAIAGSAMLAYCKLSGRRVAISWNEGLKLGVIGCLLLSVSNVGLAWAEQWVPTGLAALIVSITPLWFLLLGVRILPGERRLPRRGMAGLGLGFAGIVVLLWPQLRATGSVGHAQLVGSLVLLVVSFAWGLGSVLSSRWKMITDVFTASGWEMVIAAAINLSVGTVIGDWSRASWTWRGWGAVLYLVVFGSLVGYSAYIWLLAHVPTSKVSTYAYVNPVVAVFLGWLVLNEAVTGYILAGTVIIVLSVALVTGSKLRTREPIRQEVPVSEAGD